MLLGVRYRLEYKLEADNKSPVARVEEVKGLNGAEEKRRGGEGKEKGSSDISRVSRAGEL